VAEALSGSIFKQMAQEATPLRCSEQAARLRAPRTAGEP